MSKIFISYAHEDYGAAKRIYDVFTSKNENMWLDEECLLPGQDWRNEINKAINRSSFFLLLLSNNSVQEGCFVQEEILEALKIVDDLPNDLIFIIPIRLENCEIPERIINLHYVDMFPDFEDAIQKIANSIKTRRNLGRIERAEFITKSIDSMIKACKKNQNEITIRMRAAFTSISNMIHYGDKGVDDLTSKELQELDKLLIDERDKMITLLDFQNVNLKCVCWPMAKFLKYYTTKEKIDRFDLLRQFLNDSLNNYLEKRQILCDISGSYGNVLILDNKYAIVSNPQFGGYKGSTIFKDSETISVLISEFDNSFKRISRNKINLGRYVVEEEFNKMTIFETLNILDQELKGL